MHVLRSMARAGKKITFVFLVRLCLTLYGLEAQESTGLDAETLRRQITEEAPAELVNLDIGDSSVSLRLSGRWKGALEAGWGFSLTPFGVSAIKGDTPFFTQEGDLTLSLWIDERWFVEASFMDNSSLNTYRAGYRGLEGEPVRYIGVGNTGLDFPAFPYLDLGGDSPSSFGAYGHFGAGNLAFHSLVRYDAAAREERVFVGNRERTFSYTAPDNPQRGISFVLPDGEIDSITEVYIQDAKGGILDSEGRRWRLAGPSEYGAGRSAGLIELSPENYSGGSYAPEGMIAVAYTKGGDSSPWKTSLGNYSTPGTFLGEIREWFDESGRGWDLSAFPQCGGTLPSDFRIGGTDALVIYEPGTFSPFETQNRYHAPSNTSTSVELVKRSTGEIISGYAILPIEENSISGIIRNTEENQTRRSVYEIVVEGGGGRRSAGERWPFGNLYPELYLPGKTAFTEDLVIRFTNYSAAGVYFIGTDLIPGSIQVFRNGIQDPNFSYNLQGGEVTLANTAGFSEVIRITYLKQSSERRLGSLAAGIGAVWNPDGPFSGKIGLGLRWNVSSETYSENSASSPGTVGLGAEAQWDFDRLRAGFTLGLGFEQPDTVGLYRAAGMEGNELTLPLPYTLSFISETPYSRNPDERVNLVYRNYRETSILGTSSFADINSPAPVVSGQIGPYPARDESLSSQVLVAEFDFSAGNSWTGFEVPLGESGAFLEKAGKIEVPFRLMYSSQGTAQIEVFLQIGSLADEGSGNPENPGLVMEKVLYSASAVNNYNEVHFEEIILSDTDREKLQNAEYLRLLIVFSGNSSLSGKAAIAPPIVKGSLWRPVSVTDNEINPLRDQSQSGLGPAVSVFEEYEFNTSSQHIRLEEKYSSVMERLHSVEKRQRILDISWKNFMASNNNAPGTDGRINSIPFANYSSLSFFVRRPKAVTDAEQADLDTGTLNFIIAGGPSSLQNPREIILELKLPLSSFSAVSSNIAAGEWARIDIYYREQRVTIDGINANDARLLYRGTINTQETENSTYIVFFIAPDGIHGIPDGNMAIDEIILENSVSSYRFNTGAHAEWTLPGAVFSVADNAIISDLSFGAAVESGAETNFAEQGTEEAGGSFGINGRTLTGVSILGFRLTGSYSYSYFSSQIEDYTWAAGHSISRLFGRFSIRESFDNAASENTMNHRIGLNFDTRINGTLLGEAVLNGYKLQRRWQAEAGGRPLEEIPFDFFLEAAAVINEKNISFAAAQTNYGTAWLDSFNFLLPDSGADAENRNARFGINMRLSTLPFGTNIYFQGSAAFQPLTEKSQSASMLRLDFPLAFERSGIKMLFRSEREYKTEIGMFNMDFYDDGKQWIKSFGGAVPLMFSVPFYSFFNNEMNEHINNFALKADLSQFADRFEFSLQRPVSYSLSSFFLPSGFSLKLGRVLEYKLDTSRDTLSIGASFNFSSINIFGAMGVSPLFNFYSGDEFNHSLETAVNFPRGESVFWSLRSVQSAYFYGFSGADLSLNNTLTVNSLARYGENNYFSDSLTASWIVPMEKTLLGSLYDMFARNAREQSSWFTLSNLAAMEYTLQRKESLEFIIEKMPDTTKGDYIRFSLIAGHESIVRIFGRLNLSVFAKLKISEEQRIFSFLGTVGVTMNLMF